MSTKDVTDRQVCEAVRISRDTHCEFWPCELLAKETGECEKVCYRAMERAAKRDLLDCGVSLRTGWLTDKGKALLAEQGQ